MKLALKILGSLVLLLTAAGFYFYLTVNNYQSEGELKLAALDAPVTVSRDSLAIPYIQAQSLADALRAQGFITGQDRLYQAQLYRLLALGRVAEVFGERGLKNDTLIRVIGIRQLAEKQAAALDQQARDYFNHYIEGLNAYITEQQHEHPLSVKMLGIKPEPWTLQDIVAVQLFQAWSNGSNWRMDILNQQLINALGAERAQQIAQITINPDDNSIVSAQLLDQPKKERRNKIRIQADPELLSALPNALQAGSNAWASGSRKSASGKPIFANNPHLRATTLPGFWHPVGLFTPELTAVGVASPGSPGIGVGRTEHIAYGATVGGSDGADLYIEQLDPERPDHYLEGENSFPLAIREEIVRIKDKQQPAGFREQRLRIRSSARGPLVSDHGIAVNGDRAVSLRWAVAGTTTPSIASDRLLVAKNLAEAREALKFSPVALSYIVVDKDGGIGRISSGRVPIRTIGDGAKPISINYLSNHNYDNWNGLIPSEHMPVELNPDKDWVGTANHRVVKANYPYKFSKIFAVSWRYRRIKEFMEQHERLSVDDHWDLINDLKNPMAIKLVPLFVRALAVDPQRQELADILKDWDHLDRAERIAPTLFQVINKHFVRLTFEDEIPESVWPSFFDAVYFWQERFVLMQQEPDNVWFDISTTEGKESRDDVLQLAIDAALTELQDKLGSDHTRWQWGKLHTITFASPVIPGAAAARWLGAGTHPMFGSGETLNRGAYKMTGDYAATVIDSVRLVADMADDEKILATIPGGTSGRYFDKSLANQTENWLSRKPNVIWFSQTAVEENTVTQLQLVP